MYEQRIDRNNPTALVFLVDHSSSMGDRMDGAEVSRAVVVAEQINGLLFELVQRCTKALGELPRPYFAVSVVGYGTDAAGVAQVGSLLQGGLAGQPWAWTSDLAQHPARIEERTRQTEQGSHTYRLPIWVDPIAQGGTPMCAAMNFAGRLLKPWCDRYPNSFPPIVINVTDGESTDGDPAVWVQRLTSLRTTDGPVLLFNLGIGTGTPALFVDAPPSGPNSEYVRGLWEMSSALPPSMRDVAAAQGFPVTAGARGFACNADFRAVASFLNIGTSVGHLLR